MCFVGVDISSNLQPRTDCKVHTWYAESKNGRSLLDLQTLRISSHCCGVGSTPVGLCAHACNRTIAPG